MRRIILTLLALFVVSIPTFASGGLDNFMADLNIQAKSDLRDFSTKLSMQFGIPEVQVYAVINSVKAPADAFMVLQLGQWTHTPPEKVLRTYDTYRQKGWGEMARRMGIKPGSARFHQLKNGNLAFSGRTQAGRHSDHGRYADNERSGDTDRSDEHGRGKGNGRGHNE